MKLSRLRLATNVQIFTVILVVVAMMALVFTADRGQREAIVGHAGALLGDRVEASGDVLRAATDTLREDVLFLAKTPPVAGIMRAEANAGFDPRDRDSRERWCLRLQEIFTAFGSAHADYYTVRFIGIADGGKEIVRVERRDGVVVVVPEQELAARAAREYFGETAKLREGEVYLSDWTLNASRRVPTIRTLRAATPVYAPSGALFGMVVINLDVGPLLDAITARLPAQTEAYLADDRGRYLIHPDPERAFGFERGRVERMQEDFPGLRGVFATTAGRHLAMRDETTAMGQAYVTAQRIHYDPRLPQRFLVLAYAQRPEAFAAELDAARSGLILRGVAASLLLGAMILLVLRRLFHPLRQITDAANAVAEGARDVALPDTAGGEVGELSHSVATMLARVGARERDYQRLNEELEERVGERTKELQLAATVVASTSEGVVVTDAKARIVSVNPAFTEITGYAADEVLGANPRLLKSDHHDDAFYRELWQELLRTGRWQGELWNRRKGGEAYLEHLSINMIRDAEGKPLSYVGVFSDVTESRRKDERIRHLAFHDPLTGLPNRFLLTDRLQHAIGVARRERTRLALMFIDLDRFKGVNDSLGHDVGDLLLREIADRLKAGLRDVDTVARMGGDEFIALLENVDEPEHCATIARNLIEAVAQPMELGGHPIQVGASIGIAFYPEDGAEALELMKQADTAMYAAKAGGRGAFRFFQAAMTEQASKRLRLEIELRQAIERGDLELHYQPKVCLTHGAVRGVEALVRWRHGERGLVLPAEFVPVAEESGLIIELGNWVLAEACRQAAEWQARGIRLPIAVNVSARQLERDHLTETIAALTSRHGIEPDSLEVELTESAVMTHPEEAIHRLHRLRELGVSIAVDDFGTGYSSLAYLRRLPIDTLKIDRSFVMNAERDDGDAQVVRTIVALARGLHLTVVAEGVETETQARLLRGSGCDLAQGYHYARPAPAAALEAWLAADSRRAGDCDCQRHRRLRAVQ